MVELPTAAEAIVGELRPADREALKIAAAQLREHGVIHPDTQKQLCQVVTRAQGICWDIMHDDARPSDDFDAVCPEAPRTKRWEVWRANMTYPGWNRVACFRWRWRACLDAWISTKQGWTTYEVREARLPPKSSGEPA